MADTRTKRKRPSAAKRAAEKPDQPPPLPPEPARAEPIPEPLPLTAAPAVNAGELATAAASAHAQAMIQSKFTIAQARPRSLAKVRERLMDACARPGFIETSRYSIPVGGGKYAQGWSIRFAEAALQAMGNIHTETHVVFDDDQRRGIRVEVVDLESNVSHDAQWILQKTVERKQLKKGQVPISDRENSDGQVVYLVAATEDDMLMKQNNLASKALRNCGLRLVPGDILDDCLEAIHSPPSDQTMEVRIKRTADGFMRVGVPVAEIEKHLGHALDKCTGDEISSLWRIYTAIRGRETTWAEVRDAGKEKGTDTGTLNVDDLAGTGEADGAGAE